VAENAKTYKKQVFKILDEKNVACIPGSGFGADQYIRLSFATSMDRIEEGTKRLAQWFSEKGKK